MLLCPYCGATNQDDSEFCDTCRQPLSALGAEGLSPVNISPDASNDIPEIVPPWLEKLLITHGLIKPDEEEDEPRRDRPAAPPVVEAPVREPEAKEPAPVAEGETVDWLADLRERSEEPSPIEAEEPGELPPADWLQALRIEPEKAPETPLPAEEESLEWLRGLGQPEAEVEPLPLAEPAPPPVETPEAKDEGLPDWLRGLGQPEAEVEPSPLAEPAPPPVETPEAKDEELPDWLRGLGQPEAEVEPLPLAEPAPPPVETPEAKDEELPDWLRGLSQLEAEVEPAPLPEEIPPLAEPSAIPAADEEGLPAWLAELRKEKPGEEAIVYPTEPTPSEAPAHEEIAQVPDWLRDLGITEEEQDMPSKVPALIMPETQAPAPGLPPKETVEAEEEKEPKVEIPQWLQEIQKGEPAPEEETPEERIAPPDWLAQTAMPDVTVETEAPIPDWLQGPVPSADETGLEEKESTPPDWLQEASPPAFPLAEIDEQTDVELPLWLEELQPSAKAPPISPFVGEIQEPSIPEAVVTEPEVEPEGTPEAKEEEMEGLARADIPEWLLALRPGEPGEEPAKELEIEELSGPLAGIKGVLPVEPIISLPHLTRPEAAAQAPPTPLSGDLLAEIVAQPALRAAPVPRRKGARVAAGAQRVFIYLLILAAVVVPLLMGPIYGPLDAADLQGGADTFYPLLEGQGAVTLPADSVVVVAFDYNPAMAAELSLQAQAIIDHLMRRDLRIMAISLYPEGAALASDILDELAVAHGYTYGENYIHLGYLPNRPTSVRYFLDTGPAGEGWHDYRAGRPISQYPIAQGVDDLSAVRLVIELTGDNHTLQTWVEQMTARANVPLVAGVSAAVAPYVQPYLDSGQLRALLVGLPGAAEYEAQAGRTGDAIKSLGSQVAAQGGIVLLILLGNLVHLVTRGGKK